MENLNRIVYIIVIHIYSIIVIHIYNNLKNIRSNYANFANKKYMLLIIIT